MLAFHNPSVSAQGKLLKTSALRPKRNECMCPQKEKKKFVPECSSSFFIVTPNWKQSNIHQQEKG